MRWNRRYLERAQPASFQPESRLVALAPLLGQQGRALEIAGGTGSTSLWLAGQGWHSTLLEVSVEALRMAHGEARRRGARLDMVVGDSAQLPIAAAARFDLVVVVRYLDRTLFERIPEMLAPGGQVFYCTFNRGHLAANPRFNPEFVLGRGELDRAFAGLERRAGDDEATASWILARRPSPGGFRE